MTNTNNSSSITAGDAAIAASAAQSPLKETTPDSLDEFLSRDPFEYSKQDRNKIVGILRAQRATWDKLEAEGKKVPRSSSKGTGRQSKPTAASLEDLGLLSIDELNG